ncbi:MAG: DUF4097 domain-containing protein [Clostridiales bacterium]|jgi:hypothetical protein|nr:DUF4097 domain-containing protein [Clostridiales bacterium]
MNPILNKNQRRGIFDIDQDLTYDERNINALGIDSTGCAAKINIIGEKYPYVNVRLNGSTDGRVNFTTDIENGKLKIKLELELRYPLNDRSSFEFYTSTALSSNMRVEEGKLTHNGVNDVTLDVYIPKKVLDSLDIETISGDVKLEKIAARQMDLAIEGKSNLDMNNTNAERLDVRIADGHVLGERLDIDEITSISGNGFQEYNGSFKQLDLKASVGNIHVETVAQNDMTINAITRRGNVSAKLGNIGESDVELIAPRDGANNSPAKLGGDYAARGSLKTYDGLVYYAAQKYFVPELVR